MTGDPSYSDASRVYNTVFDHLQYSLWTDIRNAETCAWMVTGSLLTTSSNITDWIPKVLTKALFSQSTERRFNRWLENPVIDIVGIYGSQIVRALKSWGEERLVIALDTSMLFEKFCLIQLSILYRSRAVPLAWRVIEHESSQVSFGEIAPLLGIAQSILEAANISNVLLLADRGFADTNLMRCLTKMDWHYRIRIKSNFKMYGPEKKLISKIGAVSLQENEAKFYQGVYLTEEQYGPVYVAFAQPENVKDSWQVVSDEPSSITTFEEYGWRFQIEEGFKDNKSAGLNLEDSHLRNAVKLERMVLIHAISMLFSISEGTSVVESGSRRQVDPHWKRGISYLQIGLRSLNQALSQGKEFFKRILLVSGADPDPVPLRKGDKTTGAFTLKTFFEFNFFSSA
jgi:hypothetical protein